MAEHSFDTYQTSFVGRQRELRDLGGRLAQPEHLVTLVGPPGTGKTRLAMQFADLCRSRRDPERIWFVDLTDATDQAGMCANIARELGCDSAVETIARALADAGPALVVLDNFEHLVALAPATLGRWLPAATAARFLVTSRQRLRIPGERAFDLSPLAIPDDIELTAKHVLSTDGGRLFVDRAGDFDLSDADAPVVAEIIRRLDGIPLALELAATRLSVMGPAEILDRLGQRFQLLSAGPRGAAARQATLEGAIEWSWTLLSPLEQQTMVQCSVFRGGFPLEAAESVVELGSDAATVLDLLQALTEKSLVRCIRGTGSAPTRFAFYESIREFARARLEHDPQRDDALRRHALHYEQVGKKLGKPTAGARGPGFLKRFEIELDNLARAFETALEDPKIARQGVGRALAATMAIEKVMTGRPKLGAFIALRDAGYDAARAAGFLDAGAAKREPLRMRAAAYRFLSAVYAACGRSEDGRAHFDRAVAIAHEIGDPLERGRALYTWGALQHDPARAGENAALVEEALAIARKHGDDALLTRAQAQLGNLRLFSGQPETAVSAYEQAIAGADELDAALLLGNLAIALQELSRFDQAREMLEQAIQAHRTAKRRRLEGGALACIGAVFHERGDLETAVSHYDSAIAILSEEEARRVEGLALACLASAHAMADRSSRARTALSSAEARTRDIDDAGLWATLALHTANVELAEARDSRTEDTMATARARARYLLDAALAGDVKLLGAGPGAPLADQWDDIRFAARLLQKVLADDALLVATDGSWFRAPGADRVDLARRHVLRRLLSALASHRENSPGETLSLDELIENGWPDERMDPTAAANRVHVALTTLRKLGLRDLLERSDSGYRLLPSVPLSRGS